MEAGIACSELDTAAESCAESSYVITDEPTLGKVMTAVKKLKNGKATVPMDCHLNSSSVHCSRQYRCMNHSFESGGTDISPQSGYMASLYRTVYKGKDSKNECSSYRPISLFSVPRKVFAHVLLERLKPLLEYTDRPNQSGFTAWVSE